MDTTAVTGVGAAVVVHDEATADHNGSGGARSVLDSATGPISGIFCNHRINYGKTAVSPVQDTSARATGARSGIVRDHAVFDEELPLIEDSSTSLVWVGANCVRPTYSYSLEGNIRRIVTDSNSTAHGCTTVLQGQVLDADGGITNGENPPGVLPVEDGHTHSITRDGDVFGDDLDRVANPDPAVVQAAGENDLVAVDGIGDRLSERTGAGIVCRGDLDLCCESGKG